MKNGRFALVTISKQVIRNFHLWCYLIPIPIKLLMRLKHWNYVSEGLVIWVHPDSQIPISGLFFF